MNFHQIVFFVILVTHASIGHRAVKGTSKLTMLFYPRAAAHLSSITEHPTALKILAHLNTYYVFNLSTLFFN